MGDFYEAGIDIWAGFGPVGITKKNKIWADYEQLFRPVFSSFHGHLTAGHLYNDFGLNCLFIVAASKSKQEL